MNKILYIEDDLDYDLIIDLFSSILTQEEIVLLEDTENDEDEILKAIKTNPYLRIFPCFTDVLELLSRSINEFDLMIVDRNLSGDGYKYKKELAQQYLPENGYDRYFSREGDFILSFVRNRNYDVRNKFFFYTAYDDPILLPGYIELLPDGFKENNILIKGDGTEKQKIKTIIESICERINDIFLKILRENLPDNGKTAQRYLEILKTEKNDLYRINQNLLKMRKIYDAIIEECKGRIPKMKRAYKKKNDLNPAEWLADSGHINILLKHFFNCIFSISSSFGAHVPKNDIYNPTLHTVTALENQLKDVILWFGQICDNNHIGN